MKTKLFLFIIIAMFSLSCTEQQRTRNFGGTSKIELPKGKKLIMATWKDNDLFYLVEGMDSSYIPKEKTFIESASFGMLESTVIFIESK